MVILNITFNVEKTVLSDWKRFMTHVFIPYANVQEKFAGHNFYQVMVEDAAAETYSYQLIAKEESDIDSFKKDIFPALIREMNQAFGQKVLFFDTILKEVALAQN